MNRLRNGERDDFLLIVDANDQFGLHDARWKEGRAIRMVEIEHHPEPVVCVIPVSYSLQRSYTPQSRFTVAPYGLSVQDPGRTAWRERRAAVSLGKTPFEFGIFRIRSQSFVVGRRVEVKGIKSCSLRFS